MKSYKNIGLLVIGLIAMMVALASCGGESTIPSAQHAQPIHGETRWN